MKAQLFAAGGLAALLTACSGGGGSQTIPPTTVAAPPSGGANTESIQRAEPPGGGLSVLSTFTARDSATGTLVHILPPRNVMAASGDASRSASTGVNLSYHGGPVQTAPRLYVVFWGAAWNTRTGDPDGVQARLKSFYPAIGGKRWLNSVKQYTQSNGQHVGNAGNIFGGSFVDTSSAPPKNPTQSQMAAEAAKAAAHFRDLTSNASYVVAMAHGIVPQGGFGSTYCAYHSWTSTSGHTIAWTNLPYVPDAGYSCGAGSVNSPGTLDGVTIIAGHEQGETETDPFPNDGWLDGQQAENGDKCAWMQLENNPYAGGFPTQPLWSNMGSRCLQSS